MSSSSTIGQEPVTINFPYSLSSPALLHSLSLSKKPSRHVFSCSLKTPTSKIQSFFNEFNRFVTGYCEKIPIGFASVGRLNGEESGGIGLEGKSIIDDDGVCFNAGGAGKVKKVLILMSDTGGGHRASAEAIKAAFNQEFGDEYQVALNVAE